MTITHKISLDMMHPQAPERIHVKQGDTYSRILQILLYCDGEAWPIPGEATPVIRWFACDPDTGASTHGIYDTLPDGTNAWLATENQLTLVLTPEMLALAGLVQADVALVIEEKTLATFNFEFYVNPAPATGTEPEAGSYYKVATLEQLNDVLARLEVLINIHRQETDELISMLEPRITTLEGQVATHRQETDELVSGLEPRITTLEGQVATQRQEYSDFYSELDRRLTSLENA